MFLSFQLNIQVSDNKVLLTKLNDKRAISVELRSTTVPSNIARDISCILIQYYIIVLEI